jgi:hypothetical protein
MPENASVDGAEIRRSSLLQIEESALTVTLRRRIGSGYQLLFLGLLLIAAQCGFFVYLAFPIAYIPILMGHWIAGAKTVPTVIQASNTDAFKYLGVVVAEWLEFGGVWFIVRSGVRPRDLIGLAQSRKRLLIEVGFGIGLGVVEASYSVLPILLRNTHPHINLPRLPGEAFWQSQRACRRASSKKLSIVDTCSGS